MLFQPFWALCFVGYLSLSAPSPQEVISLATQGTNNNQPFSHHTKSFWESFFWVNNCCPYVTYTWTRWYILQIICSMSITKGQSCTVADPGYGSGGEKKKSRCVYWRRVAEAERRKDESGASALKACVDLIACLTDLVQSLYCLIISSFLISLHLIPQTPSKL